MISFVNAIITQFPADLVTFTEEILCYFREKIFIIDVWQGFKYASGGLGSVFPKV